MTGARAAGYHLIPLPTGLPVGDVNAWLVEGTPLTLVDCGLDRASALGALEHGLAELGHGLADVGLLVVTHPHPDHFGLAAELVRRTGMQVACLDVGAGVLRDWDRWAAGNDKAVHAGLIRHGVEPAAAAALRDAGHTGRFWAQPVEVDRVLRAGEPLVLSGRVLDVLHLPGHSEGDTVLHDRAAGVLVAGDHLLSGISSNALASTPFAGTWDGRRRTPLLDYRASLRRTRELEADIVLGGHGPPVTGHAALIDERLAAQDERAARLLALLDGGAGGGVSAHELARRMWGPLAERQVFATLSEVLGHLDLLLTDGAIVEDRSAHVITFAAT